MPDTGTNAVFRTLPRGVAAALLVTAAGCHSGAHGLPVVPVSFRKPATPPVAEVRPFKTVSEDEVIDLRPPEVREALANMRAPTVEPSALVSAQIPLPKSSVPPVAPVPGPLAPPPGAADLDISLGPMPQPPGGVFPPATRRTLPLWDGAPSAEAAAPGLAPPPAGVPGHDFYDYPVAPALPRDELQLSRSGDLITLIAREAPLSSIVQMIAQQHSLNLVLAESADVRVTLTLTDVPLPDALDTLLAVTGCSRVQRQNVTIITRAKPNSPLSPNVHGRQVRVFDLNFISATDVEKAVKGLLSPTGQLFGHETSTLDKRRTREQLTVEDLPEYVARIEEYLATIDRPPRQVMIEAHILQVTLGDDMRHGVNLSYLAGIAGSSISLASGGFANPLQTPAFVLDVEGNRLNNVVEAIKTSLDSKTLASPKVIVLNGQEAKIQIGSRLGYFITTTTQTSTMQNVDFLDVGVVLNVVPQITQDGQVLMKVKPEVSDGAVNATTGLPDKRTTEVDTSVMLPDGYGIVIGGLIQEKDIDRQSKLPWLGDMKYIGRLFQRRTKEKERSEIIITLVPRIVPYDESYRRVDEAQYNRAMTPLFEGPLVGTRRGEPILQDAVANPYVPPGFRRGPAFAPADTLPAAPPAPFGFSTP